jgi:hypothetical protein
MCTPLTLCVRIALGRALPGTRKLLADILAGQNQMAIAVDEYRGILEDEEGDAATKLEAARRSLSLLQLLGRGEEAESVAAVVSLLELNGATPPDQ